MSELHIQPVASLHDHEANSQARYECLSDQIKEVSKKCEFKETDMGMDNISDKVNLNINPSGGDGGLGGAGLAALMMASKGGDSQSNIWASILPALMNQRNDGAGMNSWWPLLLLLGRHGGVLGGGCEDGTVSPAHAALLQTLLEGQSDLKAAIPTAALETTNALQNAIAQLALGVQQSLANTKDSVQAAAALNLTATNGVAKDVATGTLQTQIAINNDGDKTRQLLIEFNTQNLQRELTVAQSALSEERIHRHSDSNKVEVTQNVNQQQAQAQFQQQQQDILRQLAHFGSGLNFIGNQVARNTNDIVTVGGLTNATQSANPVNVK